MTASERYSLVNALAIMIGLFTTLIYLLPYIVGGDVYLSTFSDDFYYYLIIAENLAIGQGSTFNGLVTTNGYHPLWEFTVTILEIIGRSTGINTVLLFSVTLITLTLWYLRLLLIFVNQQNFAASAPIISASFMAYLYIAMTGMEVALLLPLLMYFILYYQRSVLSCYRLGFIASLAVLSRLDVALFILLFLGVDKLFGSLNWGRLLKFCLGGFLVPAYVISNYVLFGTAMPVSGQAKAVLEIDFIPHMATFVSFFKYDLPTTLLNGFMMAVWLAALVYLRSILRGLDTKGRVIFVSALVFVPIYYYITSIRSDWPIWRWYFYPLVFFLAVLSPTLISWADRFIILAHKRLWIPKSAMTLSVVIGISLVFGYFGYAYLPRLTQINSRHFEALQLQEFAKSNPGIYAMGDRAGLASYLMRQPMVQLEGLVMDHEYLQRLETAKDLDSLLRSYNVDYYIGHAWSNRSDGCYMIKEPMFSHGESRNITSKLCWPVVQEVKKRSGDTIKIFKRS